MPATNIAHLVSADDARRVADLRLAARGDGEAQLRLAAEARELVEGGGVDDIIGSMEGVHFARLAAAQGIPDALMILAEHCAHLAMVYTSCGETECGEDWHGQALGVMELAAENMPANCAAERAELMQSLSSLADEASPAIMQSAVQWRNLWAPAFAVEFAVS